MTKQLFILLGLLVAVATPSFASEVEVQGSESAVSLRDSDRFYTIYVGRTNRGRRTCFDYQGRNVVVEGDMVLRVQKAVYWTDGNCDLYY